MFFFRSIEVNGPQCFFGLLWLYMDKTIETVFEIFSYFVIYKDNSVIQVSNDMIVNFKVKLTQVSSQVMTFW